MVDLAQTERARLVEAEPAHRDEVAARVNALLREVGLDAEGIMRGALGALGVNKASKPLRA